MAETANDQRPTRIWNLLCASRERQQCDIPCLLDGSRQTALMRSADTRQAAWRNLSALRDELRQQPHIFVIDRFDLLDAELANFLAPEKLAPTFAWSTRTSAWTRTARWTAAIRAVTTTTLGTAVAVRGCCFCFFCHSAPAFSRFLAEEPIACSPHSPKRDVFYFDKLRYRCSDTSTTN